MNCLVFNPYSGCDYNGNEFLALCLDENTLHSLMIYNINYISADGGSFCSLLRLNNNEFCGLSFLHVYNVQHNNFHTLLNLYF